MSEKNLSIRSINDRSIVAVTDCRFLNELEFFVNNFNSVSLVYVQRDSAEKKVTANSHQSELETQKVKERILSLGGIVLDNNGDLKDLEGKLKEIELPNSSLSPAAPNAPQPDGQVRSGKFVFTKA